MAVKKKAAYTAMPKSAAGPKMTAKPLPATAQPKMKATPLPAVKAKPNIQNAILQKKTAMATAKSAARSAGTNKANLDAKKAADALRKQAVGTHSVKAEQRKSVIGSNANTIKPIQPIKGNIQDTKDAYEKMIKERGGGGYGAQRSMQHSTGVSRPKRARKVAAPKISQYEDTLTTTVNRSRKRAAKPYL